MNTKISILDENTANKIAAGEVVERPASVIKELVENAIDAGGTKIEVEIMAGGTSFMRVTDNGCGMSSADAKLSVERHATSKLRAVGDLASLATLGFRGEALPTIASVAKFSLLTRQPVAELATLLEIKGGEVIDMREAGGNIGTTIKVEDLFFNTPARKKFLKTPVSEGSHINEIILKLSLANPMISFKFINNNKLAIVTPGNDSLLDVIKSIYGRKVSDALLPLDFADEGIKITGYITQPNVIRSSRQWQTFIVNGRIIGSRSIAKAIDNAYHSLLPKSGYPLAVLNIKVPQNTIDINVHPQKSEIKFADEGRIFKAVYKTVLDAIRQTESLENIAAPVEHMERHYSPVQFQMNLAADPLPHKQYQAYVPETKATNIKEDQLSFAAAQAQITSHYNFPVANSAPEVSVSANATVDCTQSGEVADYDMDLTPLGQVDRCFIAAAGAQGLYIVDQHAAHERILYDRFAKMTDSIPSQQLLVHIFLDFPDEECDLIVNNQALFKTLGFAVAESGPGSIRLTEIPADIPLGEAEPIIREILEALQNLHQPTTQEIRHECLAITACRAAIKAGDILNIRQMQILLDELASTTLPYTCPHGRPAILKFSNTDLAKMFKRT